MIRRHPQRTPPRAVRVPPKMLAGVCGGLFAARMHEAGHDVSLLARGERLTALRRQGVQLAEADGPVKRVPVPVIEHPDSGYDLITVFVRTHQVDAVLESLAGVQGDVPFLLNWAAGQVSSHGKQRGSTRSCGGSAPRCGAAPDAALSLGVGHGGRCPKQS